MKIYGYSHDTKAQLLELYQVTISAKPQLLRELAVFLNECADGIESKSSSWNHAHFTPTDNMIAKHGPEVIVFNPDAR